MAVAVGQVWSAVIMDEEVHVLIIEHLESEVVQVCTVVDQIRGKKVPTQGVVKVQLWDSSVVSTKVLWHHIGDVTIDTLMNIGLFRCTDPDGATAKRMRDNPHYQKMTTFNVDMNFRG